MSSWGGRTEMKLLWRSMTCRLLLSSWALAGRPIRWLLAAHSTLSRGREKSLRCGRVQQSGQIMNSGRSKILKRGVSISCENTSTHIYMYIVTVYTDIIAVFIFHDWRTTRKKHHELYHVYSIQTSMKRGVLWYPKDPPGSATDEGSPEIYLYTLSTWGCFWNVFQELLWFKICSLKLVYSVYIF